MIKNFTEQTLFHSYLATHLKVGIYIRLNTEKNKMRRMKH